MSLSTFRKDQFVNTIGLAESFSLETDPLWNSKKIFDFVKKNEIVQYFERIYADFIQGLTALMRCLPSALKYCSAGVVDTLASLMSAGLESSCPRKICLYVID